MTAEDANSITLKTYKHKLQEYIDSTPNKINDAEYPWIDRALSFIPKQGKILEIGGGSGRNAVYISEQGYLLECTEAVPEFVEIMTQKGLFARTLNILTDEITAQYDMVFANGVLVHFTPEQSKQVFSKVYEALNADGIFALSVKMGYGQKWTEEKLGAPRYFYYWQPDDLRQLAETCGFEWLSMENGETSLKNASWLYIILRRKQI
jgi:cyclopropane fatty-acyl-phospholipid synthase-like methyltransferase